uniref:Uncharacterized protein n=1 Tax=Siphoviridae sp. ctcMb1 TaxID=2827276 RepID=A0A8S5R429_9CAUD|nr:MAG TPA: hypothetical protein [Siphoviridae sp. ctcMb1]
MELRGTSRLSNGMAERRWAMAWHSKAKTANQRLAKAMN